MGSWLGLSGLHAEIAYRIPVSFGLRDISASWYIGVSNGRAGRNSLGRLGRLAIWRQRTKCALRYVSELCSEKHSG